MNASDKDKEGLAEFHCPQDNALVFCHNKRITGVVEGKCRKCKALYKVLFDRGKILQVIRTEPNKY